MVEYTPRIGKVWIRDFDDGIIKKLGSILVTTGPNANSYVVTFPIGSCLNPSAPLDVPVIWGSPEQVLTKKVYPSYLVKRESFEPNLARWHSIQQMQQIWGVTGTSHVVDGKTVYDRLEISPQAWPYDITYTITIFARYEYEVQTLLKNLLTRFPPRNCIITVKDSLNDNRTYECLNDSAINDLGEIVDVSDRLKSYSISVKVLAEIDLSDPVVVDSVHTVVLSNNTL